MHALDNITQPILRSNPIFTEEEEQEVVIIVDSIEDSVQAPRTPRRAPSTSSGYGSGGGSHGRVSPKNDNIFDGRLSDDSDKNEGSQISTSGSETPDYTLPRSLKEDIRACLGGCRWGKDVEEVVEAAVKGSAGITVARARLHAALLALQSDLSASPLKNPNRGPTLPYCGPGVRPGDVTMMAKNTEMSLWTASALFTLDSARTEALSRRLVRGEKRRHRCRVLMGLGALLLLLLAVGAVELLLSRGHRVFGTALKSNDLQNAYEYS